MLENIEFISSFVEEAKSHIEDFEAGLLGIDVSNTDSDRINDIFRAIHSVKGTAGFFNLENIVGLSHVMENILGECRAGSLKMTSETVDALLEANDSLKVMVSDVLNSEEVDISHHQEVLKSIISGTCESAGKNEDNSVGELFTGFESSKANSDKIMEEIRFGKKIFSIERKLNRDYLVKNDNPVEFFRTISSIGTMIDCCASLIEDDETGDLAFHITFSSILEKKFLCDAIGIPEEDITEYVFSYDEDAAALAGPKHEDTDDEEREHDKTDDIHPVKKSLSIGIEDSIRVNVNLLNNLLNLASEMVLGRNQLLRTVDEYRKSISGIEPILQNIDHITTDLQETIMQTRMQPIANVFNKFPRIIRELSKKLGKEIELVLDGVDVELDKSIIESLADPLTHLVRNAADHGLGTPEEREIAGKRRTGQIILKAYHEGGCVNIDVIDDGKGIDIEKIKKRALEKGLISKDDVGFMGEQDALQLLFLPGFSTAERVTDVSGRGVGMDVVKTNIEKLGGTTEVFSKVGQGTNFRLLLPLTLAIIPSLIVEVEGQKFALPQVNLQEIVRIKPGDAHKKIEYIHNSEVLRLRGKLLPILHLADVLGIQRTYFDPVLGKRKVDRRKTLYDQRKQDDYIEEEDLSSNRTSSSSIIRVLVIKIGSRKFGMAVDTIHGSEEILVKPLPRYMNDCRCYSGVTIMGDGKIAMILDPEGIVQKTSMRFTEVQEQRTDKHMEELAEGLKEQLNMLLFKCSGPEFFGMDLSLVSRVDEIRKHEIEKIGDKEYIQFRGKSLRVLRPEDYMPISREERDTEKFYVIIPKLVKHPMGILVEKIHDTIYTNILLDQESIKAKGLLGSFIYNNKIILLINIYEFFEKAAPDYYSVRTSNSKGKKKSVLLVEDTPFFLQMELNYLESAGYDVKTANNGREALEYLASNQVDIVVSDIQMPVMDGIELVKKIRKNKDMADLPVIAVTSLTGEKQVKEGIDAGFDYYEFKLDRSRLLERVEQALLRRGAG